MSHTGRNDYHSSACPVLLALHHRHHPSLSRCAHVQSACLNSVKMCWCHCMRTGREGGWAWAWGHDVHWNLNRQSLRAPIFCLVAQVFWSNFIGWILILALENSQSKTGGCLLDSGCKQNVCLSKEKLSSMCTINLVHKWHYLKWSSWEEELLAVTFSMISI